MSHDGWMWKLGSSTVMGKSYKRRWFVLSGSLLTYFENEAMAKPLGSVNLKACTSFGASDPASHTKSSVARFAIYSMELVSPSRKLVIIPESADEQRTWTRFIMRQVPTSALQDTLPPLKTLSKPGDVDSDDSDEMKESKGLGSKGKAVPASKRVRIGNSSHAGGSSRQDDSDDDNITHVLRDQLGQ